MRAHFACHGGPDGLYLTDGVFTLADIERLDLDLELVTLSACRTATGDGLPDEAAHVDAPMVTACSRKVISSLWAIGDDIATRLTASLYDHLAGSPRQAAHALHRAVLDLRAENPCRPSTWAPFIHFGI